jgi:hypothetical protein
MRLAQDDEMVNALAPDRSDQPFGKAVLPRRGWRSRLGGAVFGPLAKRTVSKKPKILFWQPSSLLHWARQTSSNIYA